MRLFEGGAVMGMFKRSLGGAVVAAAILFASQSITAPASAETLVFEFDGTVNYFLRNGHTQAELDALFTSNIFLAVLTVESTAAAVGTIPHPTIDQVLFEYVGLDVTIGGQNLSYAGSQPLFNDVFLQDFGGGGDPDILRVRGREENAIGATGFALQDLAFQFRGTPLSIPDAFNLASLTTFAGGSTLFQTLRGDVFDASGEQAFFIGGASMTMRQVFAVPEPATWIMMILGFAGMGLALRSRRRQLVLAVQN